MEKTRTIEDETLARQVAAHLEALDARQLTLDFQIGGYDEQDSHEAFDFIDELKVYSTDKVTDFGVLFEGVNTVRDLADKICQLEIVKVEDEVASD